MNHSILSLAIGGCLALGAALPAAAFTPPDQGRLLLTGGVSALDGAAGGGLSTWALIGGYGTRDSYSVQARHTSLFTQDYRLSSPGLSVSFGNRVELSYARLRLDENGGALEGARIELDSVGVKLRVFGDAILDQDKPWPQISVGLQHKRNRGIQGLGALDDARDIGARRNSDTDLYVAASKLLLDKSLLLNGTVRFTRANQYGLAGFGGDLGDSHKPEFEGAVAWLLRRDLAVGAEYRTKPRNLGVDREDSAYSLFAAWAPNKHTSVTLAYADVGPILSGTAASPLNQRDQRGVYLSFQLGY
ncbi:DUF3034 family protein [Piscinibacter sp. Jin2]|uniref:DUF3034 family protein n=1 Tax=Aquariibacter lacus TaxID=2801332 RepID=A0A9X1BQ58_9BURK|nr:DUF3034 family protein [Piscinibacter lacus]MBL0718504.1 DUF3034 family protein [Piscinibacter lacus]